MPKLPVLKPREVVSILGHLGFGSKRGLYKLGFIPRECEELTHFADVPASSFELFFLGIHFPFSLIMKRRLRNRPSDFPLMYHRLHP